MKLHELSPAKGSKQSRKRLGRGPGSGTGKTAGRGHKGQRSRSGYSQRLGFEGGQMRYIRRVPKRGFTHRRRQEYVTVNVGALSRFDDASVINADLLEETGLARGAARGVKVLGNGELTRKLTVKASAFTSVAREKIEAAGGKCETV